MFVCFDRIFFICVLFLPVILSTANNFKCTEENLTLHWLISGEVDNKDSGRQQGKFSVTEVVTFS